MLTRRNLYICTCQNLFEYMFWEYIIKAINKMYFIIYSPPKKYLWFQFRLEKLILIKVQSYSPYS